MGAGSDGWTPARGKTPRGGWGEGRACARACLWRNRGLSLRGGFRVVRLRRREILLCATTTFTFSPGPARHPSDRRVRARRRIQARRMRAQRWPRADASACAPHSATATSPKMATSVAAADATHQARLRKGKKSTAVVCSDHHHGHKTLRTKAQRRKSLRLVREGSSPESSKRTQRETRGRRNRCQRRTSNPRDCIQLAEHHSSSAPDPRPRR